MKRSSSFLWTFFCADVERTAGSDDSQTYLGQWQTPWWEQEGGKWVDHGPRLRAGFLATTEINRHDFGVKWNDTIDKGGVVVGDTVWITIDVEAVWQSA